MKKVFRIKNNENPNWAEKLEFCSELNTESSYNNNPLGNIDEKTIIENNNGGFYVDKNGNLFSKDFISIHYQEEFKDE